MMEADECGMKSLVIYHTRRRHAPQTASFIHTTMRNFHITCYCVHLMSIRRKDDTIDVSWLPAVIQTCTNLWHNVSMALNPLQLRQIFVASQYGTAFMSPFWCLEFGSGSRFLENYCPFLVVVYFWSHNCLVKYSETCFR